MRDLTIVVESYRAEGNQISAQVQYYSLQKQRFFLLLQSDRVKENLNRLGGMRYNPRLVPA